MNYARFYSMLNRMPYEGDKEELKRDLVRQCTNGRTESLREVTQKEYAALCAMLERNCPKDVKRDQQREILRQERSTCLHLMQKIGVDTSDWTAVNNFCRSAKIAGMEFRELDEKALRRLSIKLRMILRK